MKFTNRMNINQEKIGSDMHIVDRTDGTGFNWYMQWTIYTEERKRLAIFQDLMLEKVREKHTLMKPMHKKRC